MNKFLKLGIVFCILLFTNQVYSAEMQKAKIEQLDVSIEQAYQLMLENNNSLKAYNEAIEQSKFEKRATLGEFAPKIAMNSTYIHFSKNMELNTPITVHGINMGTATSLIQEQNVFTLGGGLVWNVFTGGKMLSNHAAARAKLAATNAKYREIQDALTLELMKRYYGLNLAREVIEVRKQNMECVKQHLEDAKKLEKAGIISKAERLHADVAFAEAKKNYSASIRDAQVIEEGLKALIKSENANLKNISIIPVSNMFIYENVDIDVDKMRANALAHNPQLKQLEAKHRALSAKYHAKNADFMPTISLFATDIFAASRLSEAVPRASIGGTANWMLFDGLKRENNILAVKHERKMVEYELEDAKYNIEALVLKQYQELMKYKEAYDASKESLEKATESLRVADLSFKEGYGTSLQVTDAQMMLLKVKIDRLNAIYNFDVTLTDLLKTNGDTKEIFNYISGSFDK